MARTKGQGQKLDKYYKIINDNYMDCIYYKKSVNNTLIALYNCYKEVSNYEPISDYEIKDKDNLLYQIRTMYNELYSLTN